QRAADSGYLFAGASRGESGRRFDRTRRRHPRAAERSRCLMRVRRATAADAAACADIYRPYVLDTAITFETDVPAAGEMAERIAKALAMHEWLVLEVDGKILGYAYAQQFNPRAAYRWAVETSIYLAQDGRRAGGGRLLYTELLRRLAERGFRQA